MKRWYENFFCGMALDFWNEVVPREQTRREIRLIEELLEMRKGDSLLDLLCGPGRLAVPLAKNGFKVTGVDLSEDSIAELKRSAAEERLPIQAIEGNILRLHLRCTFDGAICFGNSFAYFDWDEMRLFLNKVSGCLKGGGKFLIHSGMFAESLLPNFEERDSLCAGGITLLLNHRYRVDQGSVQTRYTFFRNGEVEKKASIHWIYTVAEIKRLLRTSGFRVAGLYRSTDKSRYRLGDPEVYLAAEKRED